MSLDRLVRKVRLGFRDQLGLKDHLVCPMCLGLPDQLDRLDRLGLPDQLARLARLARLGLPDRLDLLGLPARRESRAWDSRRSTER